MGCRVGGREESASAEPGGEKGRRTDLFSLTASVSPCSTQKTALRTSIQRAMSAGEVQCSVEKRGGGFGAGGGAVTEVERDMVQLQIVEPR